MKEIEKPPQMKKDSIEERTRGSANTETEAPDMAVEDKENQKIEVSSDVTESNIKEIEQKIEKISIRRPMLKRQDAFDHGAGV